MLAVADEDGYVSCLNTDKPLPDSLDVNDAARAVNAQWLAHDNAIFDLCWMQVWHDPQVQLGLPLGCQTCCTPNSECS
jgi:hypothetical protein